MSIWQSAAFVTDAFPHWAKAATLDVDPRSGVVQLERRDFGGEWQSFEVFDALGAYKIDVVNTPELRISATNDAVFRWTWTS